MIPEVFDGTIVSVIVRSAEASIDTNRSSETSKSSTTKEVFVVTLNDVNTNRFVIYAAVGELMLKALHVETIGDVLDGEEIVHGLLLTAVNENDSILSS